MKASELIRELRHLINNNGDLPVMLKFGNRDYLVVGANTQSVKDQIIGNIADRSELQDTDKVIKIF